MKLKEVKENLWSWKIGSEKKDRNKKKEKKGRVEETEEKIQRREEIIERVKLEDRQMQIRRKEREN